MIGLVILELLEWELVKCMHSYIYANMTKYTTYSMAYLMFSKQVAASIAMRNSY